MERSDVIALYTQSESLIKLFLNEIDKDIKGSNRVFMNTNVVKLYYAAINIDKVTKYILDGKKDSDRLKKKLHDLLILTKDLQNKAIQKQYDPIAHNCQMIIDIINNIDRWDNSQPAIVPEEEAGNNVSLSTGENNNNVVDNVKNTIPSDIMILFKNDEGKINEIKTKINNSSNIVKDAAYYLDQEKGLNKQHGWQKHAFDYFVWPYYKDKEEKYENVIKRFRNGIEHK